MSSVQEEKPGERPRAPELRNAELVSRLLAATPPYLYSALPLQPHAYFFSEMLRSFVQARHGGRAPLPPARRLKKRAPKYFAGDDGKGDWQRRVCDSWRSNLPDQKSEGDTERPRVGDIPLELTVDKHPRRPRDECRLSPKLDRPKSSGSPGPPSRYLDDGASKPIPGLRAPLPETPPSSLILPPPPPMWYPPLYAPPFGVDPLNFFIDLRVSGHIYDRKRTAGEIGLPEGADERREPTIGGERRLPGNRARHASAFSVPSRAACEPAAERATANTEGTPYVMRNLKRIYETLQPRAASDEPATKAEAADFTDMDEDGAQS